MIDLEQRLGTHVFRFLTNGCAKLPCPLGTVGRDLALPEPSREAVRGWLRELREGTVIEGSGRGLLVVEGTGPSRNLAAGALATTAVMAGLESFGKVPISATPVRTLSAASYIESVRESFDGGDDDAADLLRALKAGFGGYFGRVLNTRLLLLLDLGSEPRTTSSTFAEDQLRVLLSLRVERGFPTIVTTKLSSSGVARIYGQDLFELFSASFVPVKLGKDSA